MGQEEIGAEFLTGKRWGEGQSWDFQRHTTCYHRTTAERWRSLWKAVSLSLGVGLGPLLAKRATSWEEELDADWERRA